MSSSGGAVSEDVALLMAVKNCWNCGAILADKSSVCLNCQKVPNLFLG